jgi:hypothetical protein
MSRAVAHRMQECVLGGNSASTRRLPERVAKDVNVRRPVRVAPLRKAQVVS